MKAILATLLALALSGCAGGITIQTRYGSASYDGKAVRVVVDLRDGFSK